MSDQRNGSRIEIAAGIVHVDGQPEYVASVEYPYYRDEPLNWPHRLDALAKLGHRWVSCYVPWRHHEIEVGSQRAFDFTGSTGPSRDVIGFLALCAERDLAVILKPGPFVHAELNYGGLPDFVCPLARPDIEPMLAADGSPVCWGGGERLDGQRLLSPWPLPAPFDPVFRAEVERWFGAVRRELVDRFVRPSGPIALVQVANEGIYSNGQHEPWAYDYSRTSLDLYRRWLAERHNDIDAYRNLVGPIDSWDSIEPPRAWREPDRLEELLPYRDWSAFQAYYIGELYRWLKRLVGGAVPSVVNVNPPLAAPNGVDAWLTRVDPDSWPDVHYGFTDWIGVAADDPSVVDRYEVMVRRARGANLEENWGLSDLYEGAYAADAVPFHQTLLAAALGATGHNVFPGAQTATWDDALDRLHSRPYAPSAAIDLAGRPTSRASTIALVNAYFERYGTELLESRALANVAVALYLPYAHVAAWHHGPAADVGLGITSPGRATVRVLSELRASHMAADLVNLDAVTHDELGLYRALVVPSGPFMARAVQERLAKFAEHGGSVVILGDVPRYDDQLSPLTLLDRRQVDQLQASSLDNLVGILRQRGVESLLGSSGRAAAWLWRHPAGAAHLFVLTATGQGGEIDVNVDVDGRLVPVGLSLPGGSGAIVRLAGGRPTALLVKGRNERTGEAVAPHCAVNGYRLGADRPSDLFIEAEGGAIRAHAMGADGETVWVTAGHSRVRALSIVR